MIWQEEGLQAFLVYLKDLISKRAEEDYTSLVEGGGMPSFHSGCCWLWRCNTHGLPQSARQGRASDPEGDFVLCNAEQPERDYVGTLTNLFKDIAVAVDENEQFIAGTFGPEATIEATLGLQQVLTTCQRPLSPAHPFPSHQCRGNQHMKSEAQQSCMQWPRMRVWTSLP